MSKPHLILWGGSWSPLGKPLGLGDLDSHAKVSYFFLKETLQDYFEITGIEEFGDIENLSIKETTIGVLSTFQAGFTQLYLKHPDIYHHLSPALRGKKFSIIDETPSYRAKEDILFTVIPPLTSLKAKMKAFLSGTKNIHMGWCASARHCVPVDKDNSKIRIFIDHGHYAGVDYTAHILQALKQHKSLNFEVLIQGNQGVIQFNFESEWSDTAYERSAKIPWPDMIKHYKTADIFVLTHKESAGLSAIEAAMSGAELAIPVKGKDYFLNPLLLTPDIDFHLIECSVEGFSDYFERALNRYHDRQKRHETIAAHHDWSIAARRIAENLRG